MASVVSASGFRGLKIPELAVQGVWMVSGLGWRSSETKSSLQNLNRDYAVIS